MKTIQEQIAVMQHYANGGKIERFKNNEWSDCIYPRWDWRSNDYRIEEQKKTITIEKWLLSCNKTDKHYYLIVETSNINNYLVDWTFYKKNKLLETYEVEI